jgi:hypothetical protein
MHSAIAGYLAALFGFAGIPVMLWLGLRTSNEAVPASVQPPATLPGVRIMLPHWTPWLMGTFYALGIIVAGYLHLKAAQINRYPRTNVQSKDNHITSADAVEDFSLSDKLAGDWSYGWARDRLANQFSPFTHSQIDALPGVDRWDSPHEDIDIGVMRNRTPRPVRGISYPVLPDMLHMHPGNSKGGIYDIVRWTCPQSGRYTIAGEFCGLDEILFT